MALQVHHKVRYQRVPRNMWQSDRRIYVTLDGEVCPDDYAGPKQLLVPEGGTIALEDAERLGLSGESKAVKARSNKGRKGLEDKGQGEPDPEVAG